MVNALAVQKAHLLFKQIVTPHTDTHSHRGRLKTIQNGHKVHFIVFVSYSAICSCSAIVEMMRNSLVNEKPADCMHAKTTVPEAIVIMCICSFESTK